MPVKFQLDERLKQYIEENNKKNILITSVLCRA